MVIDSVVLNLERYPHIQPLFSFLPAAMPPVNSFVASLLIWGVITSETTSVSFIFQEIVQISLTFLPFPTYHPPFHISTHIQTHILTLNLLLGFLLPHFYFSKVQDRIAGTLYAKATTLNGNPSITLHILQAFILPMG